MRPKGCKSLVMSADGYVFQRSAAAIAADKQISMNVYSLVIAYKGATAGDEIALRDGGPTGDVKAYAIIPAANGTLSVDLGRYGVEFLTDIYYTEQVAAAGKVFTTVVHK